MISGAFRDHLDKLISAKTGSDFRIKEIRPVGGGCINNAVRIAGGAQTYFLKCNDARAHPGMFEAEARGLTMLAEAAAIRVPGVVASGTFGDASFLILEWIEPGRRIKNFWEDFGRKLAAMHRNSASTFGLDHDNYIGSLPQSNAKHATGAGFTIHERLEPQLQIALRSGAIGAPLKKKFDALYLKLPDLLPSEPPALLHGDLWSGNFMTGPDGVACLVDPAVCFGYRETDLAMTRLFDGFDRDFYAAYHEAFPLSPDYESRTGLFNLYPLLVHVNLFGGGYARQAEEILAGYL